MMRSTLMLVTALALAACGDKDDGDDTGDGGTTVADGGAATEDGGTVVEDGAGLYARHCAACHGADARGSVIGPDLLGGVQFHSDEQLVGVILDGKDDMAPVDISQDQAYEIVAWLRETLEG